MIPIVIDETTGVDRRQEMLLGGVPVPKAALSAGGWFTLQDEKGRQFLMEGTAAATWPDGSVKWLHLCGPADLEGGRRNTFTCTPAPRGPGQGLQVMADERLVTIRGGMLDVDVRAEGGNVLSVRSASDGRPLLKAPGLSAEMAFRGPDSQDRRRYRWDAQDARPQVVVQTANRVVVRLGGRFLDGSRAVSELILFLEVFRQSPELRLQPVWIYLGRPQEDLVDWLTLTAHVPVQAQQCCYAFSEDRGGGFWEVIQRYQDPQRGNGPRWPIARQLQVGSSFYRTEKRTFKDNASWLKASEGRRSQGWCHLTDGRAAVTAAMRYFWQEYPHSLAVDCDEGQMTFGLVPPDGGGLDLRRYSPLVYGEAVYETGPAGPFRSDLHGARGIAKAHELMLRFHQGGEDDAAARGLFFAHPCRLLTPGEHFAASEVIGKLAASQPARDAEAESSLERIADFLVAEREVRGWYGLMDFGDVMSSFQSDVDRWAYDHGGYAWLNTESLPDYGLWISALRSCRPDWLEASVEMSRHNRDVDVYHRGELAGMGSRHNVNHWGCPDKEWRVSMPLARRLHYYVTADPWTGEYIRNTVAVYQSYVRTTAIAPGATAGIAGILTRWEMAHDPADEKVLRNLADVYARCVLPDGRFASQVHTDLSTGTGHPVGQEPHQGTFFMNTFGGQHALVELAGLLDHKPLCDALSRHADYWVHLGKACVAVLPFLALAYRHTGRELFREACRKALQGARIDLTEVGGDGPLQAPRHLIMPGLKRGNKVTCHSLGDAMHCCPYGLAVL